MGSGKEGEGEEEDGCGERAGVAPGLLQRPGGDESGAAIHASALDSDLRVWAWAVGLGLHGCLDLWGGPQPEEREAAPRSSQAHLHLAA